MTTKEKIEVMQHFDNGGEIEFRYRSIISANWIGLEQQKPAWNWHDNDYRIKPKPVELLYEWWYISENTKLIVNQILLSETEILKRTFLEHGKTGRFFNPETKEFGGK